MNRILLAAVVMLPVLAVPQSKAPKVSNVYGGTLRLYSIDVEGGQSTLIVSPSRQSLLIDTGWPGNNDRDADRIVAAAKAAGISKIDYLLITHYHRDHVGGVPQLASKIPIGTFIDHGPNLEDSDVTREDYAAYEKVRAGHEHIVAKPGEHLPIKGMDVQVLSAAGNVISKPVTGAGQPNAACASEPKPSADTTENARSLGVLITYGKFRLLDLGDLTKDKELELVCPNNLIGKVDLFIVSHHGWNQSNTKAFVSAIHPVAAIMNNGAHKGGTPETWQIVENLVGPDRLWQLHYAVDGGPQHNVPEKFIANPDEKNDAGHYIEAVAHSDGSFEIVNSRDDAHMTYREKTTAGK
jgi:beta-lactamase superfamily II metal-dependent hydrolase